jgi:tRNA-Thr(GGU) m(6)t(6)A37 methyltransferase TsaA
VEPIEVIPIGAVRGGRKEPIDDHWGSVESEIVLDADQYGPEALEGLDAFSHIDVVYCFHLVDRDEITTDSRHPRGRADWPRVGIFAQRAKGRPNRIGVSTCELLSVEGLTLRVRGLDAIDGTPVLDVKPYLREFAPRGDVQQPEWSAELMRDYW